jgi:hypothetical protein
MYGAPLGLRRRPRAAIRRAAEIAAAPACARS